MSPLAVDCGGETLWPEFALVMVINPVSLLLADTLASAVTWHKLYRHRVRNVLARTSFTSVILRDGMFSTLPSRVGVVEVMLMPRNVQVWSTSCKIA